MAHALMYQEDHYVLLQPGQPETFLTTEELLDYLVTLIQNYPDCLTPDIRQKPTPRQQAQSLLDQGCSLELGDDRWVQWYAVRLEK